MKKLALLVVLVVVFALMSGVAFAAETPHGPFDVNSAVCAACHRAHTSSAEYLLATPRVTSLCIGCHDGGGADTDVVHGVYVTQGTESGPNGTGYDHADWGLNGTPLMGGGFTRIGGSGAGSTATTSKHMDPTGGLATTLFQYQWGKGTIGPSGSYTKTFLDCVDCHMPHRSQNYRMLRVKPTGYDGGQGDLTVPFQGISSSTGVYNASTNPGRRYTEDSGMFNTTVNGTNTISKWCGYGCHDFYYRSAIHNGAGGHVNGSASPSSTSRTMASYNSITGAGGISGPETTAGVLSVINIATNPGISVIAPVSTIYINGVSYTPYSVSGAGPYRVTLMSNLMQGPGQICDASHIVTAGTPVLVSGKGMEVYYDLDTNGTADPTFMHAVDVSLQYMARNGSDSTARDLSGNLALNGVPWANKMPVADMGTVRAYDAADYMVCTTCHRAHGTDTSMTAPAALPARTVGLGSGPVTPITMPAGSDATTNGSMLLRLDNRAVCQQCHQMPLGF